MTQEELDELAGECRLAFGYQANAFNDGVDAMLRAVSIAQAQAAESTMQEVATDGALVEVRRTNGPWQRYNIYDSVATADDTKARVDGPGLEVRVVPLYRTPPQHQAEISALHAEIDDCHKRMRLALEALRELADCGAEAWSAERPCVKDGDAAIAALEGVL